MNALHEEAFQLFKSVYGCAPTVAARAPGRVEVVGNHTDYNEGFVLSSAIDREIVAVVGPAPDNQTFEFVSGQFTTPLRVSSVEKQKYNAWINYPLGVYAMLQELGISCQPFRIAIAGTIPLGAGLSSSAALEVATALALCELAGTRLAQKEMALLCQRAENRFVGTQCGLLDQFSSIFGREGHLLYIDFRTLEHRTVALPDPMVRLVLTVSGVTHSLVESAYNDRRRECSAAASFFAGQYNEVRTLRDVTMEMLLESQSALDPVVFRRALHIVGENVRVTTGMSLLKSGEMHEFGQLLFASHKSSKNNFENSCPELDTLVSLASTVPGVFGSRLSGGGFGGATLTFVSGTAEDSFREAIARGYTTPDGSPAQIHSAASAPGASLIPLQQPGYKPAQ